MASIYVKAVAGFPWSQFGFDSHITYFADDSGLRAWTQAEKDGLTLAMQSWARVANITVEQVASAAGARFSEKLVSTAAIEAELGAGTQAAHDTPNGLGVATGEFAADGSAGNPFILGFGDPLPGTASFEVLVHELGHGFGLAHPHDTDQGTTVFPGLAKDPATGEIDPFSLGTGRMNQDINTVMSYNEFRSPGATFGHVAGPMAIDIAAMQKIYGANQSYHAGSDVYSLDDVTGGGPGLVRWDCIWDAGGIDTMSYSGSARVTIDLRPATLQPGDGAGGFLSELSRHGHGGYTIAHGVVIENAVGGSGNDVLTGNNFANRLEGGGGRDRLTGGLGADSLFGGAGRDVFDFNSTVESGRVRHDVINDFQHRIDKVDVSGIDSDTLQSGDQSFTFIGASGFTGAAGQIHYVHKALIEGDINGDGVADFRISVLGHVTLTAVDFIL